MARLLIDAIKNGDTSLAKSLVHQGIYGCIDSQTARRDGTALFFCCSRGYLELACLLMDRGASLATTDKSMATPLHGAADNGHLHIVRLLIMRGANVNAQTSRGDTPLHLAAYRGYAEISRCLVEAGADPRLVNVNDLTPQREAFSQGHVEISNYLVKVQEIICPDKSRYRTSMIQLDPPSDVEMTCSTPFHLPAHPGHTAANGTHRTSEPASTGLTELLEPTKPSDESDLCATSKPSKRRDQSFITLDPPDDVIFIHNFRCKSPDASKPHLSSPEPYSGSVPVQPKMRTPDVSLGQSGFQFAPSLPQKSAELERRSRKLPSSDLSDVGSDSYSMVSTASDTYSMVSTASDASDCFEETRRGDCDVADRQLSGQCRCCCEQTTDKTSGGPCCFKRRNSVAQDPPLPTPPISLEFSDFSDVFDSTIYSLRSVRPSNPPELRVSAPPPLLLRYHDNVVRLQSDRFPKKQRAVSVNCCQDCPAPGERPSYSKSLSVDCRTRCDGQDGIRFKSGPYLSNSSFNDLSSSYLTSSSLSSPSSSMTCINIPIN